MSVRQASRRPRWRAILLGALLGSLLAVTAAVASHTIDAHTTYLWHHGLRVESNEVDAHPFLDSTDGAHRDAIASYELCVRAHGPESRYIASHVHISTNQWYRELEAHLTSGQTGMGHHAHFKCYGA